MSLQPRTRTSKKVGTSASYNGQIYWRYTSLSWLLFLGSFALGSVSFPWPGGNHLEEIIPSQKHVKP